VLIPEPILRRLTDARILVILGIGAAVTLLGLLALLIDARAHQPYTVDFVLFYASGLHFFEGRDVYTIVPMDVLGPLPESIRASGSAMRANLNPPATVLLLAPLSKLPYAYAFWIWSQARADSDGVSDSSFFCSPIRQRGSCSISAR
jgi:hypothetical protein